jgi:hypothetical protein
MVLAIDDFGSHVARSARRVLIVVRRKYASHPQISQAKVSLGVKNQILRFNVAVDDVILMQILQAQYDAAYKEFDDVLRELLIATNLKPQISAGHIIHNEVEVKPILEGEDHVDDEGVLQLGQQFPLVQD